jgi:uncharacterized membrane protein YccC
MWPKTLSGPVGLDVAEGVAIRQCMLIALRCGELVPYLATSVSPPLRIAELAELADELRSGTAQHAVQYLSRRRSARDTPTYPAAVASALEIPSVERADSWSPHPIAAFRPPPRECLRFGVLLGGSIAIATAVALVLRGPHAFWLPMSVAFILRPDLAPVIRRAAARTVGTLIGVAIAGLIALIGNPPAALIIVSCIMASLMPPATRRGHSYAVMTFTPIVFVFIAMLGNDRGLFGARVVDTALAALLVLVVDLVAWTTSPSLRPRAQLARAEGALGDYLHCQPSTPVLDRALVRRAAFRSIAAVAASQSTADREPAFLFRGDPGVHVRATSLLHQLDRHTAELIEAGSD